jgi:hypothetical protein
LSFSYCSKGEEIDLSVFHAEVDLFGTQSATTQICSFAFASLVVIPEGDLLFAFAVAWPSPYFSG